jgi:hypothetical protein
MGLRHLWLVAALPIAASLTLTGCSHIGQSLPNASQFGSGSRNQLRLLASHNQWYVDGVHGSNRNDCESPQHACKTVAHAISLVSPGDTVNVAPAIYHENINDPPSVKIVGSGAATTILDGGGQSSVISSTKSSSTVTVSNVTLRNGGGIGDGGGIYNCGATLTIINTVITGGVVHGAKGTYGYGGAIYNCPGTILTIINTAITDNTANAGGGICNGGVLTILNSTFSGNVTRKPNGGGAIFNYGILSISNSTFHGNRAPGGVGGAIDNGTLVGGTGRIAINNSTISENVTGPGKGGGLFSLRGVPQFLQNTIVANNRGGNCSGSIFSRGYNLSSDQTCRFHSTGDLNGGDPKLGPLQNNGGPTQTMALLTGSPAIDSGNPNGCTSGRIQLKTDQRGMPRPDEEDSTGCDIGAYERQSD